MPFKFNRPFLPATLAVAGALLAAGSAAHAQTTVFSDDFSDNSPAKTVATDINWYYSGSLSSFSASTGALVATPTNAGSTFTELIGVFDTGSNVRLGATTGDYLQLKLDYSIGSNPATSGFRIGLYNNAGSNVSATGFVVNTASINGDFGYRVDTNYAAGGSGVVLNRETGADSSVPGSGGDAFGVATYTPSVPALATNSTYTLTFTLTRALTGVTETATLLNAAGGQVYSFSGTDTTSKFDTFQEVVVNSGNAAPSSYTIDNVSLVQQTATPEPASLALLAAFALPASGGFAARLRRRRHAA